MNHLMLLADMIILLFGITVGGILFMDYRHNPVKVKREYLLFYSSMTYLLVVAVVTLYFYINIGMETVHFMINAAFIFPGMALLEYSLFSYNATELSLSVKPFHKVLLFTGTGLTALQVFPVLFLRMNTVWLPVILAFIPFISIVIIVIGLNLFKKSEKSKSPRKTSLFQAVSIVLLIILFVSTVFEVRFLSRINTEQTYYVISLPAAYLLIAAMSLKRNSRGSSSGVLDDEITALYGITAREREIADMILTGKSNKEIAWDLDVSENTVRNHIYNLYQKMGIQKRMDLAAMVSRKTGYST